MPVIRVLSSIARYFVFETVNDELCTCNGDTVEATVYKCEQLDGKLSIFDNSKQYFEAG